MKSIKPGRGPSYMGGIGSIITGVFGLIWTFLTISMGAPFFFSLFGVVFIVLSIVQAVYHFKNATGSERYSAYDIVDAEEEPDPLNARHTAMQPEEKATEGGTGGNFCPYCGARTQSGHVYCKQCGKQL